MRPDFVLFRPVTLVLAWTLGACTISDKSQNAYDPSTPPSSEATATLTGTVTVEPPETGPADASGVLVSLEGANVTARTGPGGTFQLVAVPPGTYILNLSKASYETVRTAPIQVPLWYSTEPSVNLGTFLLNLARGSIGGTAHLEGESTADGISVSVSGTAHVTATNASGQYVLTQVPVGTYTVTFHKAAFVDQTLTSVTVAGQATATEPDVTLAANPGSITGTVLLPGSPTSSGVTILVSGTTLDGNPSTANGSTDSSGAFQITAVPAGVYQVLIQATGYASQQVSTAVAPATPSNLGTITLAQATGAISGTVTLDDNTDGSGTTILLYGTNGGTTLDGGMGPPDGGVDGGSTGGAPIASAVTLQDGTYTLTTVPVGAYSLSYAHAGYAPVTLTGISVVADEVTTAPSTILTSHPATILGTVLLQNPPASGDLSGTQVTIPGTSVQGTTAVDGSFELDGVSTGVHDVQFSRTGYVSVTVLVPTTPGAVVTAPTQTLSIAVGTVGGIILAAGKTDASGILVTLAGGAAGYTAVTDPTGAFLIENVPVGTYSLTASLTGYQSYTSPPFQVVQGQTAAYAATTVTLLGNPGSLAGQVLLPGSATNAGVTVLVSGTTLAGDPSTANGTTDATGAFLITAVPAGIYQVQFQATGYATQQLSAAVAPATASNLGTITLQQATGSIFGTVTLDDTVDSSGTTVLLYGAQGGATIPDAGSGDGGLAGGTPVASAVTLQDGTYTLTGIPVGSYTLTYSHGGYGPVTLTGIQVVANTVATPPDTVLSSQPGTIVGQVFLDGAVAGADLSGTQVTIPGTSIQGTTATDGSFELDGVGSGQLDVQITRPGYVSVTVLISTTPGEVVTLPAQTLLVARGGVGGTLLAAGRADASGILVTLAGGVAGDSYSAVTDPSGAFLIQNVRVGTYSLLASLAGYESYTSPPFLVVVGQTAAYAPATATLTLANTASVVGTVLAAGAAVQSGTHVLLSGSDLNGAAVSGSAVSLADGSYGIGTLPQGSYAVTFERTGYTSVALPPTAVGAGLQVTLPSLTLERATGSYSGSVTATAGSTGMTITSADSAGASVGVTDPSLANAYSAVTDSSGNYTIGGIPAPLVATTAYTLTASKPNFAGATTTAILEAGPQPTTVPGMTLAAAGFTVSGCVIVPPPVADSSGVSISLVGVAFNGTTYTNAGNGPSTVPAGGCGGSMTGATYSFSNVPNGTFTIALNETGYGADTLTGITVSGGNVALPVATLGRSTGTVTGTVTASNSGTGLAVDASSALVQITVAGLANPIQGTTDPTGTYTISGIPVNPAGTPYTVSASKPNYVAGGTTTVTPAAGATVTASSTITLAVAVSTVTGTVVVPQPPAADSSGVTARLAGVAFNGASFAPGTGVTSTTAGVYTFTNDVPPGTYSVTLSLSGYASATIPGVVVVAGTTTSVPTTTMVRATGTITGTVVASAGATGLTADPSAALVLVTGTGLTAPITGVTDSTGAYTITGVPVNPSGTPYTVSASKTDYIAAGTTTVTPVANVTVNASGTITLNVATSTVSGTVTVPSPALNSAGVTASLSGQAFNGTAYSPAATALSIASGAYTFGSTVPPGTYTVTLSLFGYNSATLSGITVVAGSPTTIPSTTLTQATGTISGTVTASANGTGITADPGSVLISVSGAGLSTPVTGVTSPSGQYVITGVPVNPAGAPYTIAASKTDYVAQGTATATPVANTTVGASTTIALNVATSTVSGTVSVPAPAVSSAGVVASISGVAFNGSSYGPVTAAPSTAVGAYTFGSVVPPGTYSVTLSLNGYNSATVSGISVTAGNPSTVPLTALGRATGTITGTVTVSANSTGIAVDASSVLISITGTGLTSAVTGSTDPSGSYSIGNVPVNPAGTPYTITATKTNYLAVGTTTATPVANSTVAAAGTITLNVATSTVSGTVSVPSPAINSAGVTPTISGVAFNGSAYGPVTAATSAAAGTYSFGSIVPPGTYSVTLSLNAYNSVTLNSVTVVAGSPTTVPLATLSRATGTVTGTVTASANGTGISVDASSALISISGAGLSTAVTGSTDPSGNYSISGVPVNPSGTPYTISATKSNYVAAGTTTVTPLAGASVAAAGTITLNVATTTVSGTVLVPSPPAANSAGVVASIAGVAFNGASYAPAGTATSAAAGTYSFGATVPPGTYSVTLSLAGFTPVTVSGVNVVAGQTTTVANTTLVRAAGSLYGTIAVNANGTGLTLGSADLLGASVTVGGTNLNSTAATTDSSGNWTISSVPVGVPAGTTYTATATKLGFTSASVSSVGVTANTSTQVSGLTLNVTPYSVGGTITVQGLTAGNYGGVSAALSGVAFDGESYSTAPVVTTSSGAFNISNVPTGTYSITLTKSTSYTPLVISPVVVGAGSSATSLTGTLLRASGTFAGTVAVSNGTTGLLMTSTDPGGFAVVVSDASFGGTTYSGITSTSGAFAIAGIPAPLTPSATYLITASKAGFTNATANVVLNPTLSATAAGTLTASVTAYALAANATVVYPATTPAGTTATISGVAFNGSAFTVGSSTAVPDGTVALQEDFTFTGLPMSSGTYTLTFGAPGFTSVSVPIAIPTASTPAATFSTRSTGSITGTVTVSGGTTGLIPSGTDKQGILVTMNGGGLTPGPTTTTDSNGTFTFPNAPTTIAGPYSVNVSKGPDWVAGTAASVTVTSGGVATASGLTLTVNAGSLPVVVQLNDFENNGNPATYASVPVSLSGTTFNGLAWGPVTLSSNSMSGAVSFPALPPGSYSVMAVLAQHTSATSSGVAVPPGGAASPVTLTLADTAAPTAPIITSSTPSPTSATSTNISIVTGSTDPTLPLQNFDDYQVTLTVPNPGGGAPTVTNLGSWTGVSALGVPLTLGSDNYISVVGVDYDGNQSAAAQLVIHSENRAPPAPTNVHIDNRPSSVRLTWSAPTGDTSSLPVAGYKIYYGPQYTTSPTAYASYTGTEASEGPSPITVGNVTTFNLTGLTNSNAFYVAITALDSVVSPAPNESPLSTSTLANPNTAPFDRAVHQPLPQFGNSIAVFRDDVVVSTGPGPSANQAGSFAAPALQALSAETGGVFLLSAYSYQGYGALTAGATVTSTRARKLVADSNRLIYAFDPGSSIYDWEITPQPGLDVIDAGKPASALSIVHADLFSTYYFDHIVPAHRAATSGASPTTHGIMTFYDGTYYDIQAFHHGTGADFNRTNVLADGSPTHLNTQAAPLDVQTIGNYVLVLTAGTIDAYTISADFTSITYTSNVAIAEGNSGLGRSMVVNWPYIYYLDGLNNTVISYVYAEADPIALYAEGQVLTVGSAVANGATKLLIAGDQLLAAENQYWYATALESMSLSTPGNPYVPVLNGSYDLNVGGELGYTSYNYDMAVSGSTVWLLNQSTRDYGAPSGEFTSTLDVVEMGGPRSIVRQTPYIPLSNDTPPVELSATWDAFVRGSRVLGLHSDYSGLVLSDTTLAYGFNAENTRYDSYVTANANYPSCGGGCVTGANNWSGPWCESGDCILMTVSGDYVFIDQEYAQTVGSVVTPVHSILVYDVSIPASVANATPLVTIHATQYPTGMAVANDYLYISETNYPTASYPSATSTWLERFDISNITAPSSGVPTTAGAATQGYSIDVFGSQGYVGVQNGFCIVDLTTYNTGIPPVCYSDQGQAVSYISVDGERVFTISSDAASANSLSSGNLSTVLGTFYTPTSEYGMALFVNGPNLYSTATQQNPGESAISGYDLSLALTPGASELPLDGDPFVREASDKGNIGIGGSIVVVPDEGGGLVLERIY